MRKIFCALGWSFLLVACGTFDGEPPGASGPVSLTEVDETVIISQSDDRWSRFELPEEDGECSQDADCEMGGCSAEVCTTVTTAPELFTTCNEQHPGNGFRCGCIRSHCRWQKYE